MMRRKTKSKLGLILWHLRKGNRLSKKSKRFLRYVKKKYGSSFVENALKRQLAKKKVKKEIGGVEIKKLIDYHFKISYSNKKDKSKNFMLEVILTYYEGRDNEFNKACKEAVNQLIQEGHTYLGYASFEVGIEDNQSYDLRKGEIITDKCYNEFVEAFEYYLGRELNTEVDLRMRCLR